MREFAQVREVERSFNPASINVINSPVLVIQVKENVLLDVVEIYERIAEQLIHLLID